MLRLCMCIFALISNGSLDGCEELMWYAQRGCMSEISNLDQDAAIEDQDHSAGEERQAEGGRAMLRLRLLPAQGPLTCVPFDDLPEPRLFSFESGDNKQLIRLL